MTDYPWKTITSPLTLSEPGFVALCRASDLGPRWGLAVLAVESSGYGFNADDSIKILFERHLFHAATGGVFHARNPLISSPTPGYPIPAHEALRQAYLLDPIAAMKSTSWGLGQVLGSNVDVAGQTLEECVRDMALSEFYQLAQMVRFIHNHRLGAVISKGDTAGFAKVYNGPLYYRNQYDTKLRTAYINANHFSWEVRNIQIELYRKGCKLAIDGIAGPITRHLASLHGMGEI